MLLNSIIINNIRSYTHEEIIFPLGISLFEGDIGSGKSTILMAIEFALFGLGSQKAESLLAKKSDTGFVILEFSVDGEKHLIKRTLKRSSTGVNQDPKNSWIKTGDNTEPLSPSELKQRVLQILKFNEPTEPTATSKIFRYAIFTPQEAMKEVLDPKNRLETIRRAFGIEDYSIAEINAKEVSSEIRLQLAVLQQKFSDISKLELQIKESETAIVTINSDIVKFESQKKELQDKETAISVELNSLQTKNGERIRLESNRENIKDKIQTAELQIKNIEGEFAESEKELISNNEKLAKLLEIKRPDTTKTVAELSKEIVKLQETNNEMIKSKIQREKIIEDISAIKERYGEKINADKEPMEIISNDLENEKNLLLKYHTELGGKQEELKKQKIQKQTISDSLQKEIAEFTQLGNACPTCKQEITIQHHHNLTDTKKKEREGMFKELESLEITIDESKSKSEEIGSKIVSYALEILEIGQTVLAIDEYAKMSSALLQIEDKIHAMGKLYMGPEISSKNPVQYLLEIKDQLVKYENVKVQIQQIVEMKNKVEKLIEKNQTLMESAELQIEQNKSELNQIMSQLESFGNLKVIISDKESEIITVRNQNSLVSSNLAASLVKLENEQQKITQNENGMTESRKSLVKFNIISQYKEWLESFFVPAIKQIEKQVLLSIWQNFNEAYRKWYSILVEDQSKESKIDEGFTPIVSQDGYDQEIQYLSGGEKTSIALAYRLTLNSLMRKETDSMKSNLLILDEPTDGFSKNQLGKIREVLDELRSEQIILVSHERELETYVDNVFHVSKQDGISKIVKVGV